MGAVFNSPTTRAPLSKMIPVWDAKLLQWVPSNPPPVYVDGALTTTTPIVAAQASVVTSTGAFSTYTINFAPVTFNVTPRIVAWASLESSSLFVLVNLTTVTATNFQFAMMAFNPGQVVVPNGHTVTVEWIAIGS